jgi:AcrR family transcriptional regulator
MLYREFPSKEDLVVAWLERCRQDWAEKAAEAMAPLAGDPAAQMIAIVRVSADDLACPGFRGCALHNTHAEFPERDHPAHRVAVDHVVSVRALLRDLAEQAGVESPDQLADRLMLVLDGLQSNGAMLGRDGPAAAAVDLAEHIVRDAVPV